LNKADDFFLTPEEQQLIATALRFMSHFARDFSQEEIDKMRKLAEAFE